MIYIAHRGNLRGPNPKTENTVSQIKKALRLGFEVEVDIWYQHNSWYIGHEKPKERVSQNFIIQKGLWLHCKNLEAFNQCIMLYISLDVKLNFFWHQNDNFALTSGLYIWTYPGGPSGENSILVLNEETNYSDDELMATLGICADNIVDIKEELEKKYGK